MSKQLIQPRARRPVSYLKPDENELPQVISDQVNEARHAQIEWAQRSIKERLIVIRQIRFLIAENGLSLAGAVQRQPGSSIAEVLASEVIPLAEACRFLERNAKRLLKPQHLGARGRPLWLGRVHTSIHREPFGVVLIVGPGNYPLFLPGCQLLQALAAGNAAVVKPGKGGTEPMRRLLQIMQQASVPPQLVQLLPEAEDAVRYSLDSGVDKVVVTGSVSSGKQILALAADKIVPVVAELSGWDAAFVLDDADLDRVTAALEFSLRWNRGETCIAPRRVLVARGQAAELEQRLVTVVEKLQHLWVNEQASPRLSDLIRDALDNGARLPAAQNDSNAMCKLPTLIVDATPEMRICREDGFGPVLSLIPVSNETEALSHAAQCPFALGATIFGSDERARKLAARVQAGIVIINDAIMPSADPRVPFAGRKQSGFGVTRGAEGLLELTTPKVVIRRGGACRHLQEPHPLHTELFHRYLLAAHNKSRFSRLGQWLSLFQCIYKRSIQSRPEGDPGQ